MRTRYMMGCLIKTTRGRMGPALPSRPPHPSEKHQTFRSGLVSFFSPSASHSERLVPRLKKSSRGRCSSGRPKDVQKTTAGSPDEVDRTTERPEPRARERKRQEPRGLEHQACRHGACALPLNQQAMSIMRAIMDKYIRFGHHFRQMFEVHRSLGWPHYLPFHLLDTLTVGLFIQCELSRI